MRGAEGICERGRLYGDTSSVMERLAGYRAVLLAAALILPSAGAVSAQENETAVLPRIIVEGDDTVVTEGTDSYVSQRVTVGGRQPQHRRDIPQTVTVVTRQALDDIAATSIEEASRITPGLTNASGDGFIGSLYARGQEVFQYYVDGAPRPFLSIYGTAPDLFFFDRMEIMSGPSGVYQGSGEPVGTLNLVRKRPTRDPQIILGTSGSTLGDYRAQADIGGAISEDGGVRFRVAAYGEHLDSFVDITEMDSYGAFGTLEVDLSPDTTIAFGGIAERSDTLRHSGLPTFTDGSLLDVPRSTFIGSPDNNADIPTYEAFVELEHFFDYGGVLKVNTRVFDQDASLRNLLASTPVDPATGNFSVFWFAREFEQTAYYADVNLTSPVEIATIPAEIVFGADYRRVEQDFKQNFDFSPGVVNINTFDPDAFPLPNITFPGVGPGFRLNTKNEVDEIGVYSQGRFELTDRLKVNVGGRFSAYYSDSLDTGRNIRTKFSETNFAPYAGVTFDLLSNVTAYASYAEIFQPQTEQDVTGANLKPRQGSQIEVGVKTDHFDEALTTQISYYHIRDRNRAVDDPANVGFFIAAGDARTEGVEVLVSGSPLPGLDVYAGYAFVSTDLTNDPTPEHSFSAFLKYSFETGTLSGLSLGFGARAVGEFDNLDGAVLIRAPGYAVFDALVAYEISETVTAQVNVENLFDKRYVERVNTTTRGTFFGKPLTAMFSVSATF